MKAGRDYGWVVGLVCALLILVLIVFITVCLLRRSVGHRYCGMSVITSFMRFFCYVTYQT